MKTINPEVLWGQFSSIYNDRIKNLKNPDSLTSKTIRKILNTSGNGYFEQKADRVQAIKNLDTKTRDTLIYTYIVCLGAGYWINLSERILSGEDFSPITESDEDTDSGNFKNWETYAWELGNVFADYLVKNEKRESEILSEPAISTVLRFAIFINENGLELLPKEFAIDPALLQKPRYVLKFLYDGSMQVDQEVKSAAELLDHDILRLALWGYMLGQSEKEWREQKNL